MSEAEGASMPVRIRSKRGVDAKMAAEVDAALAVLVPALREGVPA